MKEGKLEKLEKNIGFTRYYVPKITWLKNGVIIAPIVLLIFACFSLKFLFEKEMLYSWYAAPYIILFLTSVVFLRLAKKYGVKKEVSKEGAYLICHARNVEIVGKNVYAIFVTDEHRHDKYFTDRIAKRLANTEFPELTFKSEAYLLSSEELGDESANCYLKVFLIADIERKNAQWKNSGAFHVMFVDKKHVSIIPYSDLQD